MKASEKGPSGNDKKRSVCKWMSEQNALNNILTVCKKLYNGKEVVPGSAIYTPG